MLNKKNMAMVMAAATVATSVAPAFAATLDGETVKKSDEAKIADLKAEIKGYLAVKYSKTAPLMAGNDEVIPGGHVYKVVIPGAGPKDAEGKATDLVITDANVKELDKAIALLAEDAKLTVTVTDRGHKEVDGEIVNWKTTQYKKDGVTEALVKTGDKLNKGIEAVDTIAADTISIDLLNNETPLVVKVGDTTLDFTSPTYKEDAYGNRLDKDGKITKNEAEMVVTGFNKKPAALITSTVDTPADTELDRAFTVTNPNVNVTEYQVSELYNVTTGRFEAKGNELVKDLAAKQAAGEIKSVDNTTNPLCLTITVKAEKDGESDKIINVNGTAKEVAAFTIALDKTNLDGRGATVSTIAGTNRQQTALEVSKAAFKDNVDGQNVVLVSDYAIADGLAATPFANQKHAPILLTGKDGISEDVMKEIQRVLGKDGKVYLVGGEAVLSKNIEAQLDNKFVDFERIAGENRQETSLEIARKMSATDKVFITGGHAEADAMSVANVAAAKSAPILLVNENGLSKDQARFVKDQAATTDAYIVGGETKVPASVDADVKNLVEAGANVERIAGANRQETNAKVINEFFTAVTDVYVAKSDDKGLVDALPGGVLAANAKKPVVLATNELNASQESVLNKLTKEGTLKKTQIGYGVAAQVWEKINKIFA